MTAPIDPIDPKTPRDENGQPTPAWTMGYGVAHMMRDNPDLRYGQALMNTLAQVDPELARRVPQDVDPFYDDNKTSSFLMWLFEQTEMQSGDY